MWTHGLSRLGSFSQAMAYGIMAAIWSMSVAIYMVMIVIGVFTDSWVTINAKTGTALTSFGSFSSKSLRAAIESCFQWSCGDRLEYMKEKCAFRLALSKLNLC
jgi:hypothetical protein